jgi:hypothetical protein
MKGNTINIKSKIAGKISRPVSGVLKSPNKKPKLTIIAKGTIEITKSRFSFRELRIK